MRQVALLVILAAILIVFSIVNPNFLSSNNLINVTRQMSVLLTIGIGFTFVMLSGEIDLSVGSILGLSTVIFALAMRETGNNSIVCIIITLIVGCFAGLLNGILVTKVGIHSFLVTMATLGLYRGITYTIIQGGKIPVFHPPFSKALGVGLLGIIPLPFIYVMAILAIMHLVLKKSLFGNQVYIVGGSERVARYSGIKTKQTKLVSFLISGTLCAFAGILIVATVEMGIPSLGEGKEIDAVFVVVLGGCRLTGGWGTLPGVFLGVVVISILINGLTMLGANYHMILFVKACLLLFVIWLDTKIRNK